MSSTPNQPKFIRLMSNALDKELPSILRRLKETIPKLLKFPKPLNQLERKRLRNPQNQAVKLKMKRIRIQILIKRREMPIHQIQSQSLIKKKQTKRMISKNMAMGSGLNSS